MRLIDLGNPVVLALGLVVLVCALELADRLLRRRWRWPIRPTRRRARILQINFGVPIPRSLPPIPCEARFMDVPSQITAPPLPATYQLPAALAAYAADGSSVPLVAPSWSSDNPATFTVIPSTDGGTATLLGWKEGSANLLATANTISITIPIIVVPVPILGPVAVGLVVTFGTPVPQPTSASAP